MVSRGPNRLLAHLSVVGLLLTAGASQAGILTSAVWTEVVNGFPMTRTGNELGATGTSASDSISVRLSYPSFDTRFLVLRTGLNSLPFDEAVRITQGGPQAITAMRSIAGADRGVGGEFDIHTALHNTKGVNQSTFMTGVNTLV